MPTKISHKPRDSPSLRDRSRVVPRSDSACVFTERERSENSGFTKSRRVIGEHVSHPLVGWRTSDQDGWGLRSNLICRGIFEDFHAGSKGNLYSKIATRCVVHGRLVGGNMRHAAGPDNHYVFFHVTNPLMINSQCNRYSQNCALTLLCHSVFVPQWQASQCR